MTTSEIDTLAPHPGPGERLRLTGQGKSLHSDSRHASFLRALSIQMALLCISFKGTPGLPSIWLRRTRHYVQTRHICGMKVKFSKLYEQGETEGLLNNPVGE